MNDATLLSRTYGTLNRGIATSPANELAGYPNHTPNGVSAYNESRMSYARPLGLGLG